MSVGSTIRVWVTRCVFAVLATSLAWLVSSIMPGVMSAEHLSNSVRTTLFSPRNEAPSRDISVVAIDETELDTLTYLSPIDRKYLADVVTRVAAYKPRMIVLDIIFDRATEEEKDALLIETLKNLPVPVLLADADARVRGVDQSWQADFFEKTGRPAGYATLIQSTEDKSSNYVVTHIPPSISNRCSVSELMFNPECNTPSRERRAIQYLLPTKSGDANFATLYPRYISAPSAEDQLKIDGAKCDALPSLEDPVVEANLQMLNCRVVIIGRMTFDYGEDLHAVPIIPFARSDAQTTNREYKTGYFPGMLIHANAAQQLFDGRSLKEFGPVLMTLLMFVGALIGSFTISENFLFQKWKLLLLAGFILLMAVDVFFYKILKSIFPGEMVALSLSLCVWLIYFDFQVLRRKFNIRSIGQFVENLLT